MSSLYIKALCNAETLNKGTPVVLASIHSRFPVADGKMGENSPAADT